MSQEVNGDVPNEEETEKLKEQMWPKNTTNLKAVFESKNNNGSDEMKEQPKPIDLEAEISGTSANANPS